MDFRLNLTIEVDQKGNGLAIETPVPIEVCYHLGRWRVQCRQPRVETDAFDSLEEAVVAGSQQVAAELQAAVIDRPLIVGKITPDSIPHDMF